MTLSLGSKSDWAEKSLWLGKLAAGMSASQGSSASDL